MWCVYSHTLPDGRRYIGQTCNIEGRWKPSAYKNCIKFYNAILFYGWDAFKHEVLYDNLTLEEANYLEEKCIKEYDSINNGFNLNSGGENKLHSEETKIKMSQLNTGNLLNVLKLVFNMKVQQMQKEKQEFQEKLLVDVVEENKKLLVVIIGGS